MEVEVQVPNDECNGFNTISLNLEIDKTIGDIINNLIKNNNINNDDNQQLLLYHINSGVIFNDDITINQCIKQINITTEDKLSFNLAKIFKSSNSESTSENTENKENNEISTDDTNENNNDNIDNIEKTTNTNEQELIITNLKSEIEQYRLQISNLELSNINQYLSMIKSARI